MCELNASSTNAIPERLEAYVDLHGSTKQNQILLQYTPGPRGNAIIMLCCYETNCYGNQYCYRGIACNVV